MIAEQAAQLGVSRRQGRRRGRVRRYLNALDPALDVLAAVVVGSVARGDFHESSDVDVVVIAGRLPDSPAQRWRLVAPPHGVVQPVAWTPAEWRVERRRNPLAVDALAHGIWLVGAPEDVP